MPSSARDWSSDVCSSDRSEEHTSELQSRSDLVCRLLLEKKKKKTILLIGSARTSCGTRSISECIGGCDFDCHIKALRRALTRSMSATTQAALQRGRTLCR